jgi:hypothetical protein
VAENAAGPGDERDVRAASAMIGSGRFVLARRAASRP